MLLPLSIMSLFYFSSVTFSGPGAGSRGVAVEAPQSRDGEPVAPSLVDQSALCGGGGGGHVGPGGDGVHALTGKPCSGSGGPSYDGESQVMPNKPHVPSPLFKVKPVRVGNSSCLYASTESASGGGGDLARAGSGGGLVWIQGQTVTVEGQVLADGGGGEPMQEAIIDIEVENNKCVALAPSVADAPPKTRIASDEGAEGRKNTVASDVSLPSAAKENTAAADGLNADTRHLFPEVSSFFSQGKRGNSGPREFQVAAEGIHSLSSVPCQLSGIFADPAQLGQGGGAGGSVVIETGALLGHGTISAKGGHGGRCTGGGGGGGAIDFLWNPTSFYWIRKDLVKSQSSRAKGSIEISSQAGKEYEETGKGLEVYSRFSAFVPWLRPSEYAGGFSGSLRVGGGESDPSPACGTLHLPLGHRGSPGKVRSPLGCPPGYAGWRCSPCPVGFYSIEGGEACLSCTNKPSDDAIYTREAVGGPHCPFACAAGLPDASINPRCLPPFLFIVEQLLCCAVLVPVGAICFVLLGLAALCREIARRRGQQGWTYRTLFGFPAFYATSGGLQECAAASCSFGGLQPSPSSSLGYLGGSKEKRLMHLAVRHLTSEDLPFHVLRIYLHGRNSPDSPWGLDGQPPPFLDPHINPHRFAAFATEVNSVCGFSRSFVRLYGALCFLYPALASLLLRAARARRADKMIALCSALSGVPSGTAEGGLFRTSMWRRKPSLVSLFPILCSERHAYKNLDAKAAGSLSFWRSIRARELSFALKFGCDPDCTLGFVDVLDLDRNILDYRCSPQLPMILLTQGDGRVVPFGLSRGLRRPRTPRTPQAPRESNGSASPADPLQGALEELASPSVWACIANFFSSKVKELTAEELSSLRAFAGTSYSLHSIEPGGRQQHDGHDQNTGKWMRPPRLPPLARGLSGSPWKQHPFSRCTRCGKLQLPQIPEGSGGRAFGLLMGGPLFALRTVARLSEGIRLMSDRLLKPHGIGAAVVVLASHGFVNRNDGVKRATGSPEEDRKMHAAAPKRYAKRPPLPPDDRIRCSGVQYFERGTGRYGDSGAPMLQGSLGTGSFLLRAASSPSALLDSLRRNNCVQDTSETIPEFKASGRCSSVSNTAEGRSESLVVGERGFFTTSRDTCLPGPRQQAVNTNYKQREKENPEFVETEAFLALVIKEEAPETDGEGSQPASNTRERGVSRNEDIEAVVVPSFPPASFMTVTSPLDPRRLSPSNQPLAPYTAAAATSLQKSVPLWGYGPAFPGSYCSGAPGCLGVSQKYSDRPSLFSPGHHMPSGFRGGRKVTGSSSDLSSPESQPTSSLSPHGDALGGTTEPAGEAIACPVMCLADAARRSAGADAQHLRDAVQALQKSALAKLGTGKDDADAAIIHDSGLVSRITTTGAVSPEASSFEECSSGDRGTQASRRRDLHPLALLQLTWRRLRFRSSPTEMERQVFLTAFLHTHAGIQLCCCTTEAMQK